MRLYGTVARGMLGGVGSAQAMGARYGDLSDVELRHLMRREWARTAEDVLWRRTKEGLRVSRADAERLGAFMAAERERAAEAA